MNVDVSVVCTRHVVFSNVSHAPSADEPLADSQKLAVEGLLALTRATPAALSNVDDWRYTMLFLSIFIHRLIPDTCQLLPGTK